MTTEVDPSVIQKTQETLGKLIKKPQLTEKLLIKPPFRFLHDIINAVIKESGFLNGLYTAGELDSSNIKDKEGKMAFLQKCIDATSLATGQKITAKPGKIVAGQEAQKTNLLLQIIAAAVAEQVDSSDAVKAVLSGVKPSKTKTTAPKSEDKPKREKLKSSMPSERPTARVGQKRPVRKNVPTKNGTPSRATTSKDEAASSVGDGAKRALKTRSETRTTIRKGTMKEKSESKSRKSKDASSTEKVPKRSGSKAGSQRGKENAPPKPTKEEVVEEEELPKEPSPRPHSARTDDLKEEPPLVIGENEEKQEFETENELESTMEASGNNDIVAETREDSASAVNNQDPEGGPSSIIQTDDPVLKNIHPENSEEPILLGPEPERPTADPPDSGVGSLESPKQKPEQAASMGVAIPVVDPSESKGPSRISSAVSERPETIDRPKTGIRPRTGLRSARPPSARPAPPKVRGKREIPKEEVRPSTGKAVANLILDTSENKDQDEGDDELFVVEANKPIVDVELDQPISFIGKEDAVEQETVGEDAGLLVDTILETKHKLEDGREQAFSPETPGHRRVQIESGPQSDANRKRERESVQKEVDKLMGSIQSLTRSVNPLAKMLDYLQEDYDSMQKELEMWRGENKKLSQELHREQQMTNKTMEPLKSQLSDLGNAIEEQMDRISAIKSNMLRNAERINKLLTGINLNA